MTYQWGSGSLKHRKEVHGDLSGLADLVLEIVPFDIALTDSHRGEKEQNKYFASGASKVQWPYSKHNRKPSWAMHLDPYPINYENHLLYYVLAGVVLAAAKAMGMQERLVWGGDWNQDLDLNESFRDLAHWELKNEGVSGV